MIRFNGIRIFFTFALILVLTINLTTFDKSTTQATLESVYLNSIGVRAAFADSGDKESEHGRDNTSHSNEESNQATNNTNEQNRKDDRQSEVQNETKSETKHESEDNQRSLNETKSEHESKVQNQTKSEQESENNQQSLSENNDEIDIENNNLNATHNQTEHDVNNIDDAKTNETIAAEINIGNQNVETQSIDHNIQVNIQNSSDTVNITISATNQTGPKVILVNLNSTTIDVANIKYLHIMYDGHRITPAANVVEILHTTSSDEPHYAILITQSGAQILISVPHFSTHTITIDKISKVIPAVPEFPVVPFILAVSITVIVIATRTKWVRNTTKMVDESHWTQH